MPTNSPSPSLPPRKPPMSPSPKLSTRTPSPTIMTQTLAAINKTQIPSIPSSSTSTSTTNTTTTTTMNGPPPIHHPIPTKAGVIGYPSLPLPSPRPAHHERASSQSLPRPIFTVHKRQYSILHHDMLIKHAQHAQALAALQTHTTPIISQTTTSTTTPSTTTTTTTTTTGEGPNLAKLAFQRKWDDVRDMILKGWDCNERYGAMGGWTAAHEACLHNKHDILQLLYDHGGDMTTQNQSGNTPLHVTCMSDSAECTKLLLDWGVPIHVKNKWNATPFDFAKNKIIRSMLELRLTPAEKIELELIRDENIRIAAQVTKRKKPSDELMNINVSELVTELDNEMNLRSSQTPTPTQESTTPSPSPLPRPTHTRNASSLTMDNLTLDTMTPGKRIRHSISDTSSSSFITDSIRTAFSTPFLATIQPSQPNPTLCVVCRNKQKAIMYHPCCHVVCCGSCDTFQTRCPMCQLVIGARKIITL